MHDFARLHVIRMQRRLKASGCCEERSQLRRAAETPLSRARQMETVLTHPALPCGKPSLGFLVASQGWGVRTAMLNVRLRVQARSQVRGAVVRKAAWLSLGIDLTHSQFPVVT